MDHALLWELLLHRILLRANPKSRGKNRRRRQSKDTVASRFKAFEDGDYKFLIRGLVKVCEAAQRGPQPYSTQTEKPTIAKIQKLLSSDRFSKAYRVLDSKGQGNMQDPQVVSQLDVKHDKRVHELPGVLPPGLPLPDKIDLQEADIRINLVCLSGVRPIQIARRLQVSG